MDRPITIIEAPCNLGLRPLHPGHEPGTWRAPDALRSAGLHDIVSPEHVISIQRPIYSPDEQPGTRLRNGPALRAFNLKLADHVHAAISARTFPFVVGGDCSILLGALAGARRRAPLSLVHIDGHSDFYHPGNYDAESRLGAVAGMDLALATGRGESLMTNWPGVPPPLVPESQVVQIGDRELKDPEPPWPDLALTDITSIDVFRAREIGVAAVLEESETVLAKQAWPFWIHFDVDVLDQDLMPAVDSPGSPGISPEDSALILGSLLADSRSTGLTLTIFDPDLDPEGRFARLVVDLMAEALNHGRATDG